MLKRFFNFRPLCLIFLTFICTIFAVVQLFVSNILPAIFLMAFVAFVLCTFALSLFKICKFENLRSLFGLKSVPVFCLIVLASVVIAGSGASVNFCIKSPRTFANSAHTITATVREVATYSDSQTLLLGKVKIDGKSQNFKIKAKYQTDSDFFKVGDQLTFGSYMIEISLVENGELNPSAFKSNIQYFCTINEGFAKNEGKAFFVDYAKDKLKSTFLSAMDKNTAGFCYAVIAGDKSLVSQEYYQLFKNSGVAHILAVSGLHIAFLIAIILAICKIFGANGKAKLFVVSSILFLYNVMCEFSPSVFRASVMGLCFLFGSHIGERTDGLSSLSLAGIVVLLIFPLSLFDAGFCLSFSAVLGILLFQKAISKFLQKIRFNKFFAEPIAVTLSAGIGTIPFVCKFFGEFAPITLLSNLIVLPLFTLMYYILLPSTLLAVLISPSVLCIANFFAKVVVSFSALFAKVGMVQLFDFDSLSIALYFVILLLASPYFLARPKSKLVCVLAFVFSLCPVVANCNTQRYYDYNSVTVTQSIKNVELFTTSKNIKILFGIGSDIYDKTAVGTLLKNARVKTLDYILLCNYSDSQQEELAKVAERYDVRKICIFGKCDQSTLKGAQNACKKADVFAVQGKQYQIEGINFSFFEDEKIYKAFKANYAGQNMLFFNNSIDAKKIADDPFFDDYFNLILIANCFDSRYEVLHADAMRAFSMGTGSDIVVSVGELWTTKF